ncbi:MAG: hypothetical protein R2784_05930 [Saprospiraceae bacterium]
MKFIPFLLADSVNLTISKGYQDHFVFDYGWTTQALFGASGGAWMRGEPNGTLYKWPTSKS